MLSYKTSVIMDKRFFPMYSYAIIRQQLMSAGYQQSIMMYRANLYSRVDQL
jgi:hypothetical protein